MDLKPTAEIFGNDVEQCEIGASPDDAGEEYFWIFFSMQVLGFLAWLVDCSSEICAMDTSCDNMRSNLQMLTGPTWCIKTH